MDHSEGGRSDLAPRVRLELENFEGNAQTFRVVTKLQLLNTNRGLNLTVGTLAALMKYPVPADKIDKKIHSRKKYNFFLSEEAAVGEVRLKTGLSEGVRHPLTFIMEACDDIAYSVLDIEDAVKKGLVSVSDILSWLHHKSSEQPATDGKTLTKNVHSAAAYDCERYRKEPLSPSEFNDVSMQKLRVHAIGAMIGAIINRYEAVVPEMLAGTYDKELISDCPAGHLRDCTPSAPMRQN